MSTVRVHGPGETRMLLERYGCFFLDMRLQRVILWRRLNVSELQKLADAPAFAGAAHGKQPRRREKGGRTGADRIFWLSFPFFSIQFRIPGKYFRFPKISAASHPSFEDVVRGSTGGARHGGQRCSTRRQGSVSGRSQA